MTITLRVGVFAAAESISSVREDMRAAHAAGVDSYWVTQGFGMDALTVIAATGGDLPGMSVGTAVIPVYPRHPMALAQQALTTNLLVEGRLKLGIGPSHPSVVEPCWGMSYSRPAAYMSEYVQALNGSLTQRVRFRGDQLTARGDLDIQGASVPPVYIAALGPRMLQIAGEFSAGTVTWMVGPRTLATLTVPTIRESAEKAGRPEPEVITPMPVCVTDHRVRASAIADAELGWYETLPSYRAMLDREGVDKAARMAVIGDEDAVLQRIGEFQEAGSTTFAIKVFGDPEDRARTHEFIWALARGRSAL